MYDDDDDDDDEKKVSGQWRTFPADEHHNNYHLLGREAVQLGYLATFRRKE